MGWSLKQKPYVHQQGFPSLLPQQATRVQITDTDSVARKGNQSDVNLKMKKKAQGSNGPHCQIQERLLWHL
jgi:hypothetical protein